ncbi:hypothetical protein BGX26_010372 [Mortierella sp. AD094]|nr:hypothetical protein BGX26_010372 [Mortierella sp. AD094]
MREVIGKVETPSAQHLHSHSAFRLPKQHLESSLDPHKTHQLRFVVDGAAPSNAFTVSVQSTDTVGHLKELIKAKKAPEFDGISADRLTLWSVSISTNRRRQTTLSALTTKDEAKIKPKKLDDLTMRISDAKAFGADLPKRTIHAIIQLPSEGKRIIRLKLEIELYGSREAAMVFNKKFQSFPLNDKRDFSKIREKSSYVYFDRTNYISVLESFPEDVLLFLRLPRFGKSLFLSTMAHFHGVEHKENYQALFQGLDVDRDVKSGRGIPGQYLILTFDFSQVNRSPDLGAAENSLNDMVNGDIEAFYRTYAPYLGESPSDQLIHENISSSDPLKSLGRCVSFVRKALNSVIEIHDPLYGVKGVSASKRFFIINGLNLQLKLEFKLRIYLLADEYDAFSNEFLSPDDSRPWDQLRTGLKSLLKGFWATVKGNLGRQSIEKCFITGVSPLSMADHTSGFNVETNVSWREELSGLCGLTEGDVFAALRLPSVCKSDDEVQKRFEIMKTNYYGYKFTELGQAPRVFNTNTCLEYLESLARGEPINPRAVSNSEVSDSALQILAAPPVTSSVISDSLENQIVPSTPECRCIPYEDLVRSFHLTRLASDIATSKSAWLSYMLHIGDLTFCRDANQLQIPNLAAAERFGNATLERVGLCLKDVDLAFQNIVSTGDISQALKLYKQTMNIRDVGTDDFKKNEESHRDSFYYALLGNSHPSLRKIGLEVQITKPSQQDTRRIDMFVRVPSKNRILLLEWKVVQIDFLDIGTSYSYQKKVKRLIGTFEASDILNLNFTRHDKWRAGQTINDWILDGPLQKEDGASPCQQLQEYLASPEITRLKKEQEVTAYLIVIVGSRQILFWKMDDDGAFRVDLQLVA